MADDRGCPCLHTAPCDDRCSCVMPTSSSGCRRCCSYGSVDQRAAMAAQLAEFVDLGWVWREREHKLPIRDLQESLSDAAMHAGNLAAVVRDLVKLRDRYRLRTEPTAPTDDLPPDAPTGLYLDRPLDVEDLEWIKMAWEADQRHRYGGGPPRPTQLMLVFAAIRRDDRAAAEFLRVMNTDVLPLLRRLRLETHPALAKIGASE